MADDDFLAAVSADIGPLVRAAALGDPDAQAFFRDVFPGHARCVLCDEMIGTTGQAFVGPDPASRGMAVLMPVCGACVVRPDRRAAELALARRMWPDIRWRPTRGNNPQYLPAGGPPSKRRADR